MESTVNLGLSVLPPSIAVVGLFVESVKRQNFQQPSVLEPLSAEQCLVIICP